jgi:aerobic-type carbon monoxide dehydrogenase small subunit (CoxS/CutS family)
MTRLTINGKAHDVEVDPDTPLLWVLREWIGMTGTKYGCGIAQCGACTVHVDGIAMPSCSVPVSSVEGKQITTIEGLAQNGATIRPVVGYPGYVDALQCPLAPPAEIPRIPVFFPETGRFPRKTGRLLSTNGQSLRGIKDLDDFSKSKITERKQGDDSLETGGHPLFPFLARLRIIF